jgi:hypothetical protein
MGVQSGKHKVLIYTEYHSVCPLVGIGTPPTPLRKQVCPPPTKVWGECTRLRGGGGYLIPTTGEKAEHSAYSVVANI